MGSIIHTYTVTDAYSMIQEREILSLLSERNPLLFSPSLAQDFGEDSSLYHMLEDFLHGLITRNPADSKEAIAGHNLLK